MQGQSLIPNLGKTKRVLSLLRSLLLVILIGIKAPLALASNETVFELLDHTRSVAISAELSAFNFETLATSSALFDEIDDAPDFSIPLRVGMNIDLKDVYCYGQGLAFQSLVATEGSIQFDSIADINLSGMGSYPYNLSGKGGATVDMVYTFRMREAQLVDFSMTSSIGAFRDDDYAFSLKSSDGSLIWGATAVLGSDGEVVRSFSSQLTLNAGIYTIVAKLNAYANLSNDSATAGRTTARFAISAVPEPSSLSMTLLGVVGILVRIFRNRVN